MSSADFSGGSAKDTVAPPATNRAAEASTTPATSGSTSKAPPRSTDRATRSPARDPDTGGPKEEPGSPRASGARASGPASTERSSARSPTLRAIGPPVDIVTACRLEGHWGTRPREGRNPTTPQNDAGLRNEPPRSDPSARGTIPEARAQAAPPLEPPADRLGSTGLRVVPKTVLKVWEPAANSGTFVRPSGTTPAPRTRCTISSSRFGTWFAKSGEPYVVRQPATSCVSLNANGRPWRGPSAAPPASASSAANAPARARSSSSETIALRVGLRSEILARCRSISSRAEISPVRTAATCSRAVESTVISVIDGGRTATRPPLRAAPVPRPLRSP